VQDLSLRGRSSTNQNLQAALKIASDSRSSLKRLHQREKTNVGDLQLALQHQQTQVAGSGLSLTPLKPLRSKSNGANGKEGGGDNSNSSGSSELSEKLHQISLQRVALASPGRSSSSSSSQLEKQQDSQDSKISFDGGGGSAGFASSPLRTKEAAYLDFLQAAGSKPLRSYNKLRSAGDYAKRCFARGKMYKQLMCDFQNFPIPRSLLVPYATVAVSSSLLKFGGRGNSKKLSASKKRSVNEHNRQSKNLAQNVFKDILGYMRDVSRPYPSAAGGAVLQAGIDNRSVRDEIFVQLIKQTTNHPDEENCIRGWKLMFCALLAFSPSWDLGEVIQSHCASEAHKEYKHPSALAHTTKADMATWCYRALRFTMKAGAGFLPSIEVVSDPVPLTMLASWFSQIKYQPSPHDDMLDEDLVEAAQGRWKELNEGNNSGESTHVGKARRAGEVAIVGLSNIEESDVSGDDSDDCIVIDTTTPPPSPPPVPRAL